MKHRIKTRVLSLVLCIAMLVPIFTQAMPFFVMGEEENSETSKNTETLADNVGKQAIFDIGYLYISIADEEYIKDSSTGDTYDIEPVPALDGLFVAMVDDYFYNEETEEHWYKLRPRDNETFKYDQLNDCPWVFYASDDELAQGYDPSLVFYDKDDVIKLVTAEYDLDKESPMTVTHVVAGPAEFSDYDITITERSGKEWPISSLAYAEQTYGSIWSRALDVSIKNENGDAWTSDQGMISILYDANQFNIGTIEEDVTAVGAFLYVDDNVFSASSTAFYDYDYSDMLYTNSGTSVIVYEHMDPSFEWLAYKGYFANDGVTLCDNNFNTKEFLAAELPLTFTVEYKFKYNGETYYWLSDTGFIGSSYFLAKEDEVILGELPEEYGDGRVSMTDKNGNVITEIKLQQYEKPEISAISSFKQLSNDVSYQWQIEYEAGKWVDIYGEDASTVKLSYGLVATLLNENSVVNIRCKTEAGSKVAYSNAIPVTVVFTDPEEPELEISQDVTTSEGENVVVTVSGNIPEDAELDIEDASGTEVNGVESFEIALALDVKIKQNDSEWQPSEGETVTVSIPAAQLGLENGEYFTVFHIHNGVTELLGPFVVVDGFATFEMDGFSVVVIYTNYGAALGATAELSQQMVMLYPEPNSLNASLAFQTNLPEKIIITDYYFDAGNARLLYKIDAAPGYTWPEEFANAHWCESTDLTGINVDGTAGIFDSDGNPVNDTSVTPSAGVVVSAITSLQSADITYKWQICYDTENDLWVNISGENDAEITIVAGMVISLKDENNQVKVRCVTSAGSKTVITEPIIITLLEPQPSNDTVDVLVDGEAAENMNISASDLESFNSTLSANTTLTGDLTYSWEVLFDKTYDMWWLQGQSATFKPVFDPYKDGTYLDSNFIHAVDDTTSEIYIRLTVSDGTNMVRTTFVITVNNEEPAAASYNLKLRSAATYADGSEGSTGSGDTTIYKIVINYLYYHNMKIAAPAYTSTVGASTQLKDPVEFPTVMGYLPYVMDENGTLVRMDEWKFEGYLTEDFELNVFYQPTTVSYTINIYVQNAEDDNYQILMTRTGSALTGTVIDAISMPLPGYYQTKMTTTTASVAADGSTVFNLYYDRIYYLMKFELDGGYGVQPVFARHGVKLDIPSPTKAGYTFVGWDDITSGSGDGIADTLPAEMPINGKTYKAIWKAADNAKVTIVYWGENPNDEGYSYKESVEIYAKVGSTLTFGTNQMVCTLEEHTHDANCVITCTKPVHVHSEEEGCYGNCTHTTHTVDCYTTEDLTAVSSLGNYSYERTAYNRLIQLLGDTTPTNGTIYRSRRNDYSSTNYNFFYVNGTWYYLGTGNERDGIAINGTMSTPSYNRYTSVAAVANCTHTHDANCVSCTKTVHTHINNCYECIAHTHTNSCYLTTPTGDEYDPKLWTLRTDKNETVTVAADGTTVINVYYDRTSFTITFKATGNNGATLGTITDKWGADIRTRFEDECKEHTFLWSKETDGDSPWTSFLDVMPQENRTYYAKTTNSSTVQTAIYYGADQNGAYTITLYTSSVKYGSTLSVSAEEFIEIEGYIFAYGVDGNETTMNTPGSYGAFNGAKFYYDRAKYILEFHNGDGVVKTESVLYEANLGSYAFTPTPPSFYEAGSVQFAGWYQNPECTGDEVKLDQTTMPSSNMILYAKWIPVEHDVTIYRCKNPDGSFPTGDDIIQETIKVPHGSFLQQQYIPKDPENTPYNFVGWFYMDGNTEKAFDFKNIPVTKDLQIYAKWSSNVQLPYTIKYVLQGTNTEIAERETGKQFAGETMTFQAKTGDDLNAGYKSGYFPTVPSHSIEFDIDDNVPSYEYVFEYVYKDSVPYTVYYLSETLTDGTTSYGTMVYNGKTYYKIVADKKVSSRDAIVTENFVQVQGYMPNAYQQSLVLSGADNAVNEIYFFYTVDTVHAYYKVSHYTQNLDGTWYEYSTYESVGVIGSIYTEGPRTINGFTYNPGIKDTLTTGELTAQGLHLKLFYTRNKYPYKVEYRIEGAGTLLATDYFTTDELMKYYNESISVAPGRTFSGYHLASNSPVSHIIQIEQSENMQNPVANVIIFYYAEDEVTINYVVKGPAGCGTANPYSETVKVITGNPLSAADASSAAYKFVGWYSDEACTQLITESRIIQPAKVNGVHVAATYYAKFEYNLTSLTIKKEGSQAIDVNQSFIFNINGNGVNLDVTVHGNGQVIIDGLTVGQKYTITEKSGWSWRYDCVSWTHGSDSGNGNVAEITIGLDGTITFKNVRKTDKWLDGDSWCNNIFKAN